MIRDYADMVTHKQNKQKIARKRARKRVGIVTTYITHDPEAGINQRASLRIGNDPILKTVCKEVDPQAITDPDSGISCTIKNMMNVLTRSKTGVGLSANQAGYDVRIIIVTALGRIMAMVNPRIIDHAHDKVTATEGCLSFPGESKQIARYKWVEIEWLDELGREEKEVFGQETSRIIQHEMDHLEGICRVHEFDLKDVGVPAWLR